jgi:peptidoglycan/xylan/chitin deacetylase (PgdA/CDA1 family)
MRVRAPAIAVLLVLLLVPGCSGPATPVAAPSGPASPSPSPSPSLMAAPSPSPTPSPSAAGPPPKEGTLDRYIYDLPRFDPPPVPMGISPLPEGGSAMQVNQVSVGDRKVAFVTIDDGWMKDPDIVAIMRAAHIPFTMFLTTDAIRNDPAFFIALEAAGGIIEDHTVTHPQLTKLTYDQQRREICDNRATLQSLYGRAPGIMRAPYGLSNADTLRAAASCGIRANVFWDEYAVTGSVEYQRPGGIHPGDMVLMHFDQYLKGNLMSTLQAFKRDGITPALLEDYLVTTPPAPPPGLPPEPIV